MFPAGTVHLAVVDPGVGTSRPAVAVAAAGTLVAREAGALVTDFAGAGGLLSGQSVLAAAPELHGVMLEVLREGGHGTDG